MPDVYYISGPMTGVDYMHYAKMASACQSLLIDSGMFAFNPYGSGLHPSSWQVPHEKWLANDFHFIEKCCTAIVLLPGWQNSKGCNAELRHALLHELDVYHWNPDTREIELDLRD